MKLFFDITDTYLVLACIAPFMMKGPDGRPLITIDKLGLPDFPRIKAPNFKRLLQKKEQISPPQESSSPNIPKKMYTWRDANGKLHFSDHINPDGPYETVYIHPDNKSVPSNDHANLKGSKIKQKGNH